MTEKRPWPIEIKLVKAEKKLEVAFDSGERFSYPAEFLRVESPSAEVQGHGPGQRVLMHGKRNVGITMLDPVGHYAVRIVFDDLHDTGIFSWDYLYDIGKRHDEIWAKYLKELAEKGLSR